MAEELILEPNCKFAILAVESVRIDIPPAVLLQDGTRVVESFPFIMDNHWKDWLGTTQFNRLQSCNVFLVRTATSGWPEGQLNVSGDAISLRLQREVGSLFAMLRLLGTIEYENAYMLAGFVEKGKSNCTHFGQTERFHITRGCLPWVIRETDLQKAVDLYTSYSHLQLAVSDKRFGRGCHTLKVALEQYYASDRLHGFVRALEALIFPEPGKTEKQFVSRCALIAGPRTVEVNVRSVLQEAYKMRCDIEHVHVWDRSLQSYPTSEREDVALWRTRQIEALACAAYRTILLDNRLLSHFHNDNNIETLWKKSQDIIRNVFGDVCDITQLKLVKKYDQLGRAMASEWPCGWMEHLRRKTQSA